MADAVGVGLLFAAAIWVKLTGLFAGDPVPAGTLLLAMAGVYAVARVVTLLDDVMVPLAGAGAGVLAILAAPFEVFNHLGGPVGYANATAAFFGLAAASSLLFALRAGSPGGQQAGALGAVTFALVPWVNGSLTGSLAVLLLPFALLGLAGRRWARGVIVAGVLVWASVVALTLGLAAVDLPGGSTTERAVDASLTTRRTTLWSDALAMVKSDPWLGVGPGRFAEESATARADQDARWAHHAYLQLGAETGAVGFLLAFALVGWAFWRLWIVGRAGAAVAAAGLTGVATHAAVDYVLHFWPVALLAAALVAAGAGSTASSGSLARRAAAAARG